MLSCARGQVRWSQQCCSGTGEGKSAKWWNSTECWERDDPQHSGGPPEPGENVTVEGKDSGCIIKLGQTGVNVAELRFTGEQHIELQAFYAVVLTVDSLMVKMTDPSAWLHVNGRELQLDVFREVQVKSGNLLWRDAQMRCANHASATSCSMTVTAEEKDHWGYVIPSRAYLLAVHAGRERSFELKLSLVIREDAEVHFGSACHNGCVWDGDGRTLSPRTRFVMLGEVNNHGTLKVSDIETQPSSLAWTNHQAGTLRFAAWEFPATLLPKSTFADNLFDDKKNDLPAVKTHMPIELEVPLNNAGTLDMCDLSSTWPLEVSIAKGGNSAGGKFRLCSNTELEVRGGYSFDARTEFGSTEATGSVGTIRFSAGSANDADDGAVWFGGTCPPYQEGGVKFLVDTPNLYFGAETLMLDQTCSILITGSTTLHGSRRGEYTTRYSNAYCGSILCLNNGASLKTSPDSNVTLRDLDISIMNTGRRGELFLSNLAVLNSNTSFASTVDNKGRVSISGHREQVFSRNDTFVLTNRGDATATVHNCGIDESRFFVYNYDNAALEVLDCHAFQLRVEEPHGLQPQGGILIEVGDSKCSSESSNKVAVKHTGRRGNHSFEVQCLPSGSMLMFTADSDPYAAAHWTLMVPFEIEIMNSVLTASNLNLSLPSDVSVPLKMELTGAGDVKCEAQCIFTSKVDVRGPWVASGAGSLLIDSQSVFAIWAPSTDDRIGASLRSESTVIVLGKLQLCDMTRREFHGSVKFSSVYINSSDAELDLGEGLASRGSTVEGDVVVIQGALKGVGRVVGNVTVGATGQADFTVDSGDLEMTDLSMSVRGSFTSLPGSQLRLSIWLNNTNQTSQGLKGKASYLSVSQSVNLHGRTILSPTWVGFEDGVINVSDASPAILLVHADSLQSGVWQQQGRRVRTTETSVLETVAQQNVFQGVVTSNSLAARFVGCASGNKGTHECTPCEIGTYSKRDGNVLPLSCSKCLKGQYQDQAGQEECKACPTGKFGTQLGSTWCKACPSGHFQPELGKSECSACQQGQYAGAGAVKCELCPAGKFSDAAALECKPCSAWSSSSASSAPTPTASSPSSSSTPAPSNVNVKPSPCYSESSQRTNATATNNTATQHIGGTNEQVQTKADGQSTQVQGILFQEGFAGLKLSHGIALGVVGMVAVGTSLACCGVIDCRCFQKFSQLRRLLPGASESGAPRKRRWNLTKIDEIAKGSEDLLQKAVQLHGDENQGLGTIVKLSASYTLDGEEAFADKTETQHVLNQATDNEKENTNDQTGGEVGEGHWQDRLSPPACLSGYKISDIFADLPVNTSCMVDDAMEQMQCEHELRHDVELQLCPPPPPPLSIQQDREGAISFVQMEKQRLEQQSILRQQSSLQGESIGRLKGIGRQVSFSDQKSAHGGADAGDAIVMPERQLATSRLAAFSSPAQNEPHLSGSSQSIPHASRVKDELSEQRFNVFCQQERDDVNARSENYRGGQYEMSERRQLSREYSRDIEALQQQLDFLCSSLAFDDKAGESGIFRDNFRESSSFRENSEMQPPPPPPTPPPPPKPPPLQKPPVWKQSSFAVQKPPPPSSSQPRTSPSKGSFPSSIPLTSSVTVQTQEKSGAEDRTGGTEKLQMKASFLWQDENAVSSELSHHGKHRSQRARSPPPLHFSPPLLSSIQPPPPPPPPPPPSILPAALGSMDDTERAAKGEEDCRETETGEDLEQGRVLRHDSNVDINREGSLNKLRKSLSAGGGYMKTLLGHIQAFRRKRESAEAFDQHAKENSSEKSLDKSHPLSVSSRKEEELQGSQSVKATGPAKEHSLSSMAGLKFALKKFSAAAGSTTMDSSKDEWSSDENDG